MAATQEEIYEAAMVAEHAGLARSIARGYFLRGSEPDDVRQEALVALLVAVRDWDRALNPSFKAFAAFVIHRRVQSAVTAANREKHLLLNESVRGDVHTDDGMAPVYEIAPAPHADPADVVERREELARLGRGMRRLTAVEREGMRLVVNGIEYAQDKRFDNAVQRARRKLKAAA